MFFGFAQEFSKGGGHRFAIRTQEPPQVAAVSLASSFFSTRKDHRHFMRPSISIGQSTAVSAFNRPQASQWSQCPNELIDRSINPCIPFSLAIVTATNRTRSFDRFSFLSIAGHDIRGPARQVGGWTRQAVAAEDSGGGSAAGGGVGQT